MKEKVIGVAILILAALCPLSIWINVKLDHGIDKMQHHIDYRDSIVDETNQKYYNALDTIDSLNLELFRFRYQPR